MNVAPHNGPGQLEAPPIDLVRVFRTAAIWLVVGFAVAFALLMAGSYLLVDIVQESVTDPLKPPEGVTWTTVAGRCAQVAGVIGFVLFIGSVLWQSPVFLAKAFAVAAFGATFFGLLMLVIFIYRMSVQAYSWFDEVPPLLEARNEQLVRTIGSEEQVAKMNLFLKRLEEVTAAVAKEKAERL